MQVAGKVVVVTGGANGIGRALCEALSRAGAAKVVVADLDLANAEAVAASIDGAAFQCDVGQEEDIRHVIEETERRFGPIALFCSNAGIGDLSPEQVAQDALKGIEQETFVILPHPQVLDYMRKKTENYDRWIGGMAKIQAKMRESYGK